MDIPNRIEVLGPVRAWRNGHELPLGSPQQRGVLALLAVAAGRPVPTAEIVAALWEEHPPRTAANVVQTYLRRLRRVLEPGRPAHGPSRVLPSVGDGYALLVDPSALDLARFRLLTRRADAARRTADHQQVVGLLTDALALWQGPPGSDLRVLAGNHRLRAVVEEHRAAVGWLAQTSLATGTAVETLPVVAPAAGARPLDESLQADLIRLYHAAGRRCDAVRTFLETRRRLRDEFGFDPGPELAGAYRELLRGAGPRPAGR
jgi:DNA-binding SARP family transcriptional activator